MNASPRQQNWRGLVAFGRHIQFRATINVFFRRGQQTVIAYSAKMTPLRRERTFRADLKTAGLDPERPSSILRQAQTLA
jgi:hypothetical protein